MSERNQDVAAIERGTINEQDWNSLVLMAQNWGGHLVLEREIEAPRLDKEIAVDGPYASQADFIAFAAHQGMGTPTATKAYRGLFRIYDEQQAGFLPVGHMRSIRFDPDPEYQRLSELFGRTEEYHIEIPSLEGFVADVDDALADCVSGASRLRFQHRMLPRTVGIGTIDLYRQFVEATIDKN